MALNEENEQVKRRMEQYKNPTPMRPKRGDKSAVELPGKIVLSVLGCFVVLSG